MNIAGMYKGLSFRYQVFGTTPNFLSISGSDRKVFPNVRRDSEYSMHQILKSNFIYKSARILEKSRIDSL